MPTQFQMKPASSLHADSELRKLLLDYLVDASSSQDLSDWLRNIGQPPTGSIEEKRARVREHTKYLSMTPETFPEQTLYYLDTIDSQGLADICGSLGLQMEGSRETRWRRIMREIGFREGWLPRPATDTKVPEFATVKALTEWHLIPRRGEYEKDFYPAFHEDMVDVFGPESVHPQLAIAFGNTLKIDFHIGHPQQDGVGIEFKMPNNNSDIQRAIGQMDQYQSTYGPRLLVVLLSDFLTEAQVTLFSDALAKKGIPVIPK